GHFSPIFPHQRMLLICWPKSCLQRSYLRDKDSWLCNQKVVQLWMLRPGLKSCNIRYTSTSRFIKAEIICCNLFQAQNLQYRVGLGTLKSKRKVISSFCLMIFLN